MAEIINLRRVKKQQARQDAAHQAAENRVRHGRTKAERAHDTAAEAERERERKRLDGLKRE